LPLAEVNLWREEKLGVIYILAEKLDLQVMSEGQIPSGSVGVYQYRQRFMPLIWG